MPIWVPTLGPFRAARRPGRRPRTASSPDHFPIDLRGDLATKRPGQHTELGQDLHVDEAAIWPSLRCNAGGQPGAPIDGDGQV